MLREANMLYIGTGLMGFAYEYIRSIQAEKCNPPKECYMDVYSFHFVHSMLSDPRDKTGPVFLLEEIVGGFVRYVHLWLLQQWR